MVTAVLLNWLNVLREPLERGRRAIVRRVRLQPRRRVTGADLIAPLSEFAEALLAADPDERLILRAGRRSPSPVDQIAAAVAARLILARRMSRPELVRYLQHLQNRYLAAVGPSTYSRYHSGVPKEVFEDIEKLRAEVETISHRLRMAYAITTVRDKAVADVRAFCMIGFALGLIAIVALLGAQQFLMKQSLFLFNYVVVALAGWGGALTSIARRSNTPLAFGPLAEDPVVQASALKEGRWSILFAGLMGPVFALVMLLVLMCGAVKLDGLTPSFSPVDCRIACDHPDFRIFRFGYDLVGDFASAKLLLLAFVAGFAERLVPDVLDRFANNFDHASAEKDRK